MHQLGSMPKHLKIANLIREEIQAGRIKTGEQLLPDTVLAERYGVNKRTVANGMAQLVAEGLISRMPKRGSVVLRQEKVERTTNAVAVFAPNRGHIYGAMSRIISHDLLKHSLYPVWINNDLFNEALKSPNYEPMQQVMEKILDDSPYGVIVNLDSFIPIEPLRRNLPRLKNRIVFMQHYMYTQRLDGVKYVLLDMRQAGRLMARHLIAKGHRRVTFFTTHEEIIDTEHYAPSPQRQVYSGMLEECCYRNIEFVSSITEDLISGVPLREVVANSIARHPYPPTAAGMYQDAYYAHFLEPLFREYKIAMPDDFSLVGCNDTPWAKKYNLTSINLNVNRIGQLAVRMLTNEITENDMMISPRLVERESVAIKK